MSIEIIIIDEDCPKGNVYRLSADYARTVPTWADQMTDETQSVIVHHPDTDLSLPPWNMAAE